MMDTGDTASVATKPDRLADIPLRQAAELSFLDEQALLPAVEMNNLRGYVAFPHAELDGLGLYSEPLAIPRFSLFRGEDIRLHGYRLYEASGEFFTDESLVAEDDRSSEGFNRKLRHGSTEDIDRAFLQQRDPHEINIDEEVLVIASDEPSNFGSWIFRFLPKLLLAAAEAPDAPVFCYRNPWIDSILATACPGRQLILNHPALRYRLRRPIIPSLPAPHVLLRPEIIDAFAALAATVPASPSPAERIYVSRRRHSLARPGHRIFESETKLAEILREAGFVEFFPEDHDFAQQIAAFSEARVVISSGGANLFGVAFARNAEIVVDIESGTEWAFAHSNLLSSIPARYSMACGTRTGRGNVVHGNWDVDIEAFVAGLRALGAV